MKQTVAANHQATAKSSRAEFKLSEAIYPAGLKMSAHEHEPAHLSVLRKGSYSETFGRGTRICNKSTVVFRPPHERHAVDFHNTEVRIFRVEINSRWLQSKLEDQTIPDCSNEFRAGLIPFLCTRLYREFQGNDSCSPLAIEGLLLEILAEICRQKLKSNHSSPPWLEQAREMLHASICEPPSLDAIAQAVGVHPVYLAREFRRHYHCTIGEYLRWLRVKLACRELSRLELPLSAIAANAGYYDQSHFTTTFKRYTGMTPTQYRSIAALHKRSRAQ